MSPADVPADQQGYPTWENPSSGSSDHTANAFQMEQMLARVSSATLVKVQKVTTTGKVEAVGQVDVIPLVNLIDGQGNTFKHGTVHSLPYFRLQGGKGKAVILDPKVDDIGIAIFADRDISGVKNSKKQSPPGSFRRFDMADGMFFGCFLGDKPTCYFQFTDDDKMNISPDDGVTVVTLEKDKITLKTSGSSGVFEPSKIKVKVSDNLPVVIKSDRIDLGGDPAPLGIVLDGGIVSEKVFGKP